MYVGSNKQELKVAFDTMVPLSLINSMNCQGCYNDSEEGIGFEYQKSYTVRKITDEKISFKIESEMAQGVLVSDTFWVNKDDDSTMVKEFPFLLVNQWT